MLLWLRNLGFAGGDLEVTPTPVHPVGARVSPDIKRRLLEDEEIMAIIMAFLEIKDR